MEGINNLCQKDKELIDSLAVDATRKFVSEITSLYNVPLSKDAFERIVSFSVKRIRESINNEKSVSKNSVEAGC